MKPWPHWIYTTIELTIKTAIVLTLLFVIGCQARMLYHLWLAS